MKSAHAIAGILPVFQMKRHLLVRQNVLTRAVVRGPVGFPLDDETSSEVVRRFEALMAAVENHDDH